MPGDPIDIMASGNPDITSADVERLKARYGLDRPLVERYGNWAAAAAGGDFGFSRLHAKPVLEVVGPRLWNTTVLMGLSFILALIVALPLGVVAAVRLRTWVDYAINLFAFAGFSLPSFWLALLLILLFSVTLGWLPAGGVQSVGPGRLVGLVSPSDHAGHRPHPPHHGPHHPLHPKRHDRSPSPGLYPHGRSQGPRPLRRRGRPRHAERHDPRGHRARPRLRHPLLRRPGDRADLFLPGHGQAHL